MNVLPFVPIVPDVCFWHKADMPLMMNVRFSNRPFGVKHFQTVHVAVC
jgi:hypothetical protein